MVTMVEEMLPTDLLLKIGIYMQSAAHLEFAMWRIVMFGEGIDPHSNEQLSAYLDVKRSATELVDRFRKTANFLPPHLAVRVTLLAAEIETGLPDRNLVAHGAFFVEGTDFGVAHYFRRGKGSNRVWYETNQRISARAARGAIDQIDRLQREAVSVRIAVEAWWATRRPYFPGVEGE